MPYTHFGLPALRTAAAILVAGFLLAGCTSSVGPTEDASGDSAVDAAGSAGAGVLAGDGSTPTAPTVRDVPDATSAAVPPPPASPAAAPGADRFGIGAGDDLCAVAAKTAPALVGLFDAAYAKDPDRLGSQLGDAGVAVAALRPVATGDLRASLDRAAAFIAGLEQRLGPAGYDIEAAATADPAFFGGTPSATGFEALTSSAAGLEAACGPI